MGKKYLDYLFDGKEDANFFKEEEVSYPKWLEYVSAINLVTKACHKAIYYHKKAINGLNSVIPSGKIFQDCITASCIMPFGLLLSITGLAFSTISYLLDPFAESYKKLLKYSFSKDPEYKPYRIAAGIASIAFVALSPAALYFAPFVSPIILLASSVAVGSGFALGFLSLIGRGLVSCLKSILKQANKKEIARIVQDSRIENPRDLGLGEPLFLNTSSDTDNNPTSVSPEPIAPEQKIMDSVEEIQYKRIPSQDPIPQKPRTLSDVIPPRRSTFSFHESQYGELGGSDGTDSTPSMSEDERILTFVNYRSSPIDPSNTPRDHSSKPVSLEDGVGLYEQIDPPPTRVLPRNYLKSRFSEREWLLFKKANPNYIGDSDIPIMSSSSNGGASFDDSSPMIPIEYKGQLYSNSFMVKRRFTVDERTHDRMLGI